MNTVISTLVKLFTTGVSLAVEIFLTWKNRRNTENR